MKGRKVTLEYVLESKVGTRIWIEDARYSYRDTLCKVDFPKLLDLYDESLSWYDLKDMSPYGNNLTFYEWIEEPKEIIETSKSHYEIIREMANEICNLKGLDLTEENIGKIIKIFY